MKIVLDTNRYSDADAGQQDVVDLLMKAEEINIPSIVLGELRAGFLNGSRAVENERRLMQFLRSPRVKILSADELTSHEYAQLWVQLKRVGKMVPINDIWIAALAIQHRLPLYTRDSHFSLFPKLLTV